MDSVDIRFYYRTISDIKSDKELGFDDPKGILNVLSEDVKHTFLANPSLLSDDDVCQIIALDGNRVIGSELSFPNRYMSDGILKPCRGASTLFIDEAYRKYAVGTDLMINAATITPKQDNIVAGISQMAYPLYKAMRYSCFQLNRFIFLRKSRVIVEYVFKKTSFISNVLIHVLDFFMAFYRCLAFLGNRWRMRKFHIEVVDDVPQEVEEIALNDGHKYKELHDKKWFEWNLKCSFRSGKENSKYLAVIKNKKDDIVGFFLNKVEFFEQASVRGFKNVLLGTVSEWGVLPGIGLSEFDVQMSAVRNMPDNIDGVEVATTNITTSRRFKFHLLFPMGYANMATYIQSCMDKSLKDIKNWRVRIAAGDTLLD